MATPDETRPPDPPVGLADPRTIYPGPEMFAPGAALNPSDSPDGPPPPAESDESDLGVPGLVDPRAEIPDPTNP